MEEVNLKFASKEEELKWIFFKKNQCRQIQNYEFKENEQEQHIHHKAPDIRCHLGTDSILSMDIYFFKTTSYWADVLRDKYSIRE